LPKAEINGFSVHYQQMGQGDEVVMLHGLFASLAFWYLSVMPVLSQRFHVTAYDLRGHGLSDIPNTGYTSSDMAQDLDALLDQLQIERVHLVGHSFGGAVALYYTLIHPERVRSLTLADAWVPSLQPAVAAGNSPHWEEFRLGLRQAGTEVPENLPRVAFSLYEELARFEEMREANKLDPWNLLLLQQYSEGSRVAKRWSQLIHTTPAAQDMIAVSDLTVTNIRQCARPVLAMYGEFSGCLRTLRGLKDNLPNCNEVIVAGSGHLYPIVKADEFSQQLTQFIQSQPD
jgi:pimeloyl-ACP methyl ester carboxylesterase